MYSKVKLFGHPVHPMVVPFPIVLYTTTLAAFIAYSINGDPFWFRVGYAANISGVVMARVAGAIGFLDWSLGIPRKSEAKKHGFRHMLLNLTALALFSINIWLNYGQWNAVLPDLRFGILLSAIGFLLTLGAGHLGWTLVQSHYVGVQLSSTEAQCIRQVSERQRREPPRGHTV
jgi:uncharacterized membrane protein